MDDLAPCDRATKPVAEKGLEMPRIPACPLGIGAIRYLICGVMSVTGLLQKSSELVGRDLWVGHEFRF
jgi:hypothetical protein